MTILTAKIEIDPADIANALTLSALAKALMDKLSATARTPGSLEIPCIGAMWPEQGGIYAGIMRGEFGHGFIAERRRPRVVPELSHLVADSGGLQGLDRRGCRARHGWQA